MSGYTLVQIWLDKDVTDNASAPNKYHTYIQSWKDTNPQLKYEFWNRQRVDALFQRKDLQRWRDFWHNGLTRHIERCDFARYAIMFCYSKQLYVDLDFIAQKDVTPLLTGRELILFWEPAVHNLPFERKVCNGFIGTARKHNPFWSGLMDYIMQHYEDYNFAVNTTGPGALGRYVALTLQDAQDQVQDSKLILPVSHPWLVRFKLADDSSQALKDAFAYTEWDNGSGWSMQPRQILGFVQDSLRSLGSCGLVK